MKTLKNQTIYQCDYCKKRLLSKAGARLHENDYCWHPKSPHKVSIKLKQELCPHTKVEMQYSYIPGEAVQEPSHDLCIDCNAIV